MCFGMSRWSGFFWTRLYLTLSGHALKGDSIFMRQTPHPQVPESFKVRVAHAGDSERVPSICMWKAESLSPGYAGAGRPLLRRLGSLQ